MVYNERLTENKLEKFQNLQSGINIAIKFNVRI